MTKFVQEKSSSQTVGYRSLSYKLTTLAKEIAYGTGSLDIYHRLRNRNNLTVAMFHRVLPRTDLRWSGADPEWTMNADTFAACLRFFKKHYHPISIAQLAAACAGKVPLPARSLLITFDDGWADTAEYAQPILDELGLSALVFIAGSVIDQTAPFWQESVYRLLAANSDGPAQLRQAMAQCNIDVPLPQQNAAGEKNIRLFISALEACDKARLTELARVLQENSHEPAAMMTAEQLKKMSASRHGIGSHGMTHQPLTKVANPGLEVALAKDVLSRHLDGLPVDTMSFPHGAYDTKVAADCRAAGYQYLFSSDALLNKLYPANSSGKIWGRIHISERAITDIEGRFHPFMLATWLFLRPSSSLHID
ncbi:polysaccharide deacetylase family protein [Undibacterium sp.]|uniref:polysaccharide deacetylase family protein n=1 Tax=Undibacterium sp. TaxID=1914977 RepID=UPI002BA98624|nr:polysaccharide deacetylase family protein [Undibacterium sp.]HTD05637.1 polysaccharide deacetylase family protein [Undibacterium sp.]